MAAPFHSERAFNPSDNLSNVLRIVVGAIVGWAFSLALPPVEGQPLSQFAPFLGGFSTRLVVGVFTQLISAVELTFGLEDQGTKLALRKAKHRKERESRVVPTANEPG